MMKKIVDREAWFWSCVDRSRGEDACWPWLRARNQWGYGDMKLGKTAWLAHRFIYQLINGPIKAGLEIKHSCDNPCCCNPKHLSCGTHTENVREAVDRKRHHMSRRNSCIRGHQFNADNISILYSKNGRPYRRCLTCLRDDTRRYRQKKKEQEINPSPQH